MKTLSFLILLNCLVIACNSKTSLPATENTTPLIENTTNQTIAEEEKETLPDKKEFQGKFYSTKGIMDPLSCYCYNSGYLMEDGKRIPLCFDKGQMEAECKSVKVNGFYKTIKIDPEKTNPCPAGSKQVFMVQKYECI